MKAFFVIAKIISVFMFFSYGLLCLFSKRMSQEFVRYGYPQLRKWTGALEVLGATGIAMGYFVPTIQSLASLGLAVLMACAIVVRIRIRDTWVSSLPAFFLMVLNLFIFGENFISL